jgi:uncharacterized membrane protein
MKKNQTRYLCQAAMIAALYVVLTWLSAQLGLASMAIQCRLGEALCILPLLIPAAVPGLGVGCFVANLVLSSPAPDLIFGTLATVIGAVLCRLIGRVWHSYSLSNLVVATLPNVIANTVIVPLVLRYAYHLEDALWLLAVQVGVGELISGTVLGVILALSLPRALRQRLLRP